MSSWIWRAPGSGACLVVVRPAGAVRELGPARSATEPMATGLDLAVRPATVVCGLDVGLGVRCRRTVFSLVSVCGPVSVFHVRSWSGFWHPRRLRAPRLAAPRPVPSALTLKPSLSTRPRPSASNPSTPPEPCARGARPSLAPEFRPQPWAEFEAQVRNLNARLRGSLEDPARSHKTEPESEPRNGRKPKLLPSHEPEPKLLPDHEPEPWSGPGIGPISSACLPGEPNPQTSLRRPDASEPDLGPRRSNASGQAQASAT